MWLWETERDLARPDGEHESWLIDDLRALRAWFKDGREYAFGYGRTWVPGAVGSYPVVLLDSKWQWLDEDSGLLPVRVPASRIDEAPPALPGGLPRTKLPLLGIQIAAPRPAASTFANRIARFLWSPSAIYPVGSKRYGTADVAVTLADGTQGIATAGHVLRAGIGTQAERLEGVWPLRRRVRLGAVEHQVMPDLTKGPGWDLAVVRPERPSAPVRRGVIRPPSSRFGLEPAYTRGATSGYVDDIEIIAGLEEVRGIAGITWHCCWLVGPTSALQGGDSGAPVFLEGDDTFMGVYVGHATNRRGTVTALFAQDAYSLQHNVLNRWGASF